MFGLQFAAVDVPNAVRVIRTMIATRRGRLVIPVNTDVLVKFLEAPPESAFRQACLSADLLAADGMPVVLAARLLKQPLPGRVAGIDLMLALCHEAAESSRRVFFLGGGTGVAEKAGQVIARQAPKFQLAGHHSPPIGFEHNPSQQRSTVDMINAVAPDILCIALGAGRQESWAHTTLPSLDIGVALTVGGSFDIVSGRVHRAPKWLQATGGEWLWRLALEPRRLGRRYLIENPRFLKYLAREWRVSRTA